jgi:dTMP kinase|tara:strand:- start:2726 stop:3346 length:621 start_codon:yes stop_codon:yes gene_type:complete
MKKGKFIVFEGNEGTGKTTHITFASNYLKSKDISHIITREPGGTPLGEKIREILLDSNSKLDAISEALLFYSSRIVNYNTIILEALNKGEYVICDRFHYSTLVYQGMVQKNDQVISLHNTLDSYFSKDISKIFFLDSEISSCLQRINRRESTDKFEQQGEEFLVAVRDSYHKIFKDNSKVTIIRTDNKKEVAENLIREEIDKIINE